MFFILMFFTTLATVGQTEIYHHNFGTAAFNSHPYTAAPVTLATHLSNSAWSNSLSAWTSTAGATGEAIRLTNNTAATVTLTFTVAPNYQLDVTSFSFWRQRSNFGAQNWNMTINGISVGNGTVGTTGMSTGNTNVSTPVIGLSGTITVVISLSGSTGNGTFRLDDFKLNGLVSSSCSGANISSFVPASGPQNTLVTINGTGFQSGTGTSAVNFNGIPAVFNVLSDTQIKAYVPAGNFAGLLTVITNACEATAPQSFVAITSVVTPIYTNDIFISELYDAQAGDGGIIELYNGTAATVNLSGYTLKRYGDIGVTGSFYTIVLSGTIPPGGIFLVGIGTGTVPCAIVSDFLYSTGFNSNDEFELLKNGVIIDNVHAPSNVGYSVIRNSNAIAPKVNFNSSDWNTSNSESCGGIGNHTTVINVLAPLTSQPSSTIICEGETTLFSVALANASGFSFQWKMLNAAGTWINVPNTAPYSGAGTAILTISAAPLNLDDSQYYCAVTSSTGTIVSIAGQLEVNTSITPTFTAVTPICSGATLTALPTTSNNGITGVWLPALDNLATTTYTFTPNAGPCATTTTLTITVDSNITPTFTAVTPICSGATLTALPTTSNNSITGVWSPALDNLATTTYTFTPTAGQCATTTTLTITVNNNTTPTFTAVTPICSGATLTALPTTSNNGITGVWSPALDNLATTTYTFTPTAGQCATTTTLTITVNNNTTPTFTAVTPICSGAPLMALPTTSNNGITGVWSPALDNLATTTYTFTPNAGQCATTTTLTITVNNNTTPTFTAVNPICAGTPLATLPTTSNNGITGSWSPAFNNLATTTYTFTPTAGQCATITTLTIDVDSTVTPTFTAVAPICLGASLAALPTTSNNGITGIWSPALDDLATTTYTFTPDAGQCATTTTLTITVNNTTVPTFTAVNPICADDTLTALPTTSNNGITGSWAPALNNLATTTYTFTPTVGQCAATTTLTIVVNSNVVPTFTAVTPICSGKPLSALPTTSNNGITGSWSPELNNLATTTYTFTPNAGQCAVSTALTITVNNNITPTFTAVTPICSGAVLTALPTTSNNGITGSWAPALNILATTIYTFTPDAGQCATTTTLTITVNNNTTPTFTAVNPICAGTPLAALPPTSNNGITGSWAPALNNLATTTYTFTQTAGQCAATTTLIIVVNSNVVPTFTAVNPICSGTPLSALPTTSNNGITGVWSPTLDNLATTTYTFTPTAGQCATTTILTITVNNTTVPTFTAVNPICSGTPLSALPTISNNGITGSWSPALNNLATTTYTFTPTAGQCATSTTMEITVNNTTTPTFTAVNPICSGAPLAAFPTTSNNGITGSWSPALDNLATTTYTYTPDAGQCATTTTLTITVNNNTTPTFTAVTPICSGATLAALPTTSNNGITGVWSPALDNLATTTYTFTPNAGQCATTTILTITVNNNITPTFTAINPICSGTPLASLPTTSNNGITGSWSPALDNLATTTYTFTPTAGQCATTTTLTITVNNNTTPTFTAVTPICSGATLTALPTTSNNGITGIWSPALDNLATTTYTFTPNAGQCATSTTMTITVNNTTVPTFTAVNPICSGTPLAALPTTSNNGIAGSWSPALNNLATTIYTFTPTAGQCAATTTLTIVVNSNVVPTFTAVNPICSGTPLSALPNTSNNGIAGSWSPTLDNLATTTYTFTPDAGQCATTTTLTIDVDSTVTPTFTAVAPICSGAPLAALPPTSNNGITGSWAPALNNLATTTYTFTPNAGECATNTTMTITVNNTTVPTFTAVNPICSGTPLSALPTTSNNGIAGSWSPALNNLATTTYTFTPTAGQCATNTTMTITVTNNTTLTPITGSNSVCISSALQLSNATTGGFWSSSNPNIASIDPTGLVSGLLVGQTTITYTLSGSCTSSINKVITVNALPEPILKDQYLCIDNTTGNVLSTVILNCGIPNGNHDFIWTRDGVPFPSSGNSISTQLPGIYQVIVVDLITGCSSSASATVGISSLAVVEASVGFDFARNQTINVSVTGGSGVYEFQLDHGPFQDSPIFTGSFDGEYDINVRDKNGCGETTLSVFALNYPRFFTPNGDGYNDFWNIEGLFGQPKAKMNIFDRYGKLIKSMSPSETGWDGTYNGQNLPATDYWFTLAYINRNGEQKEFRAHFSLKR